MTFPDFNEVEIIQKRGRMQITEANVKKIYKNIFRISNDCDLLNVMRCATNEITSFFSINRAWVSFFSIPYYKTPIELKF